MLCTVYGKAQLIKSQSATTADYISLLERRGYKVLSFDITPLTKDNVTYCLEPIIKHYVDGKEIDNGQNYGICFTNREMLSQYDKKTQVELLANEKMYDAEKGIYKLYEKLTISFSPLEKGYGKAMSFNVNKFGIGQQLTFKEQLDPDGKPNTFFHVRPFKIDNIKVNEYYPLALLEAAWWDEGEKTFRFCGETILSPDMSDDIIKFIPEYYIVGVIIKKI